MPSKVKMNDRQANLHRSFFHNLLKFIELKTICLPISTRAFYALQSNPWIEVDKCKRRKANQ